MYATHKAGGCLAALIGFEVMQKQGLLIPDLEPWIQLILMYPATSFGSTFPDLDHHWGSVKEHTPTNFFVHKLLHLTQPKHRSWQTHSLLITGGFCVLMFSLIYAIQKLQLQWISPLGLSLITLLLIGLNLGIASHLVLDLFTTAGIWLVPGVKLRLVPKSTTFSTDTTYERIVRVILYIACALMLVWVINPFDLQGVLNELVTGGGTVAPQ